MREGVFSTKFRLTLQQWLILIPFSNDNVIIHNIELELHLFVYISLIAYIIIIIICKHYRDVDSSLNDVRGLWNLIAFCMVYVGKFSKLIKLCSNFLYGFMFVYIYIYIYIIYIYTHCYRPSSWSSPVLTSCLPSMWG